MTALSFSPVPALSIAGMRVSLIIAVGLPVALCILVKRRFKSALSPVFVGAGAFVVFACVLEALVHNAVLSSAFGARLQGTLWAYALYGGAMAALFEEFGRLIAMKLFMKNKLTRENALMYGVGHGGIEAILIVGVSSVANLIYSAMINSGALEASLSALDAASAEALHAQLSALWTTAPALFFASGVERISAITLQIALSYFVYRALAYGERGSFAAALLVHCGVDFAAVLLNGRVSIWMLELIIMLMSLAFAACAYRLYRADGARTQAAASVTAP